jgi:hypothetical protein
VLVLLRPAAVGSVAEEKARVVEDALRAHHPVAPEPPRGW